MENRCVELIAATLFFLSAQVGAEDVSFRLAREYLVIVPVLLNGQGPYDFLLDTGSTTSVVDKRLSAELGLKPLQQTVIRTASGTERVAIARVHQIDLGGQSTKTVLVLCSDMASVHSLDGNVRGILGFNFLSRFRYTLDYKGRALRFDDVGAVEGTQVPFDASERAIVLETERMRLILDTGANGVFLFDADGLDVEIQARAVSRVSTSTGLRVTRSGFLRRLDIGDESFERVPVTLVPQSGLEERAGGLVPGTLFDSIHFDHANGFIVLNPKGPCN